MSFMQIVYHSTQEDEQPNMFHIKMKIKRSESSTSYYVLQLKSATEAAFLKQKHEAFMVRHIVFFAYLSSKYTFQDRFPIPKLNYVEALDQLEVIIRRFEFMFIDIHGVRNQKWAL